MLRTLREKCPNTDFFLVRFQSKYGKIRTRKNSVFGHFLRREEKPSNRKIPKPDQRK